MKVFLGVLVTLTLAAAPAFANNTPPGNDDTPPGCEPSHNMPKKCDDDVCPELKVAGMKHDDDDDCVVVVPGPQGPPGPPGPAGTNGTNGTNGVNGVNGVNGAPGAPGAPGASPRSCTSRRSFKLRLPRAYQGVRIVRAFIASHERFLHVSPTRRVTINFRGIRASQGRGVAVVIRRRGFPSVLRIYTLCTRDGVGNINVPPAR
jgi:Collagen triple helix repeat (20 copies)